MPTERYLLALVLLSCVVILVHTQNSSFCANTLDCYPDEIAENGDVGNLIVCGGTGVCQCIDCFQLANGNPGKCMLSSGCWALNQERSACVGLNSQRDYFPLVISLYITSGLSLFLILLSIFLMYCTIKDPHQRRLVNRRRKMDFIFSSLIGLVVFSTTVFFGSLAGSITLVFIINWEVLGDFFDRCT